jgi:multimeric flavodoxin WrbA
MVRYLLSVREGETLLSLFRTNTYEYAPQSTLDAQKVAWERARQWEENLRSDPLGFLASNPLPPPRISSYTPAEVVVIQGSPRGEGNCSILAGWSVEAAEEKRKTVQVLYPHDLDIHPCIGCYQCYNTGYCIYDDDMGRIIGSLNEATLVVICSPVYTMTVPAGMKALMDRCQAYHAQRLIARDTSTRQGLLMSVAGRKGTSNFTCLQTTVHTFFSNLGIVPAGDILVDNMDRIQDIRKVPRIRERVMTGVYAGIARDDSRR